jgi:uncharacterized integral membrane protein
VAFGYLVVAILAAATAVFAIQNSAPTHVRFLAWGVDNVPVSALILISLGTGLVLAGFPLWIQRWRLRGRARSLETRVKMLEANLAERHKAELAEPTPTRPRMQEQ